MSDLTEEQYKKIEKAYLNLMYKISHRTGGDRLGYDFEDVVQELRMTAIEAVNAFSRKIGKPFDEFFGTDAFNRYIKTCLWNKKNTKGRYIQQRYGVRNVVSLDKVFDADGDFAHPIFESANLTTSAILSGTSFGEVNLDQQQREVVDAVMGDASIYKPNGEINISKLARRVDRPRNHVKHILERLEQTLEDYKDESY